MSSWTIYGANGEAKAVVEELELHDEWMAECFLTITIKSATPIDFEVGDYIDYRDERYTINYDPSVLKKARRGTYGDGFTYENIKFVAVQDEVVRCDFIDIVLSDNQMHYTQLPTFPFYCETVDDLLDRIQANLEDLYPGGWTLISPDLDKDRQRGMCVGREEDFVDAYNRYIGGGTFTYEKTGVALTADNNTCWDALKWVNEQFDLNFVVRGRVIVVGTAGAVIGNRFHYGKGNGLYEVEKISDSEQKIITRLRGYGAETNLPDRYYSERNARPCFYVSELDPAASTPQVISVLIDNNKFNNVFTEIIDEVSGSQKIAIGECEMDGIEFSAGFELVNGGESTTASTTNGCTTRMLIGADGSVVISGEEIPTNPQSTIDALKAAMVLGSKIIFNSGVNKKYVDSRHITASSTGLPDNMSVNRLMLPGFPSKSLAEWVEDHMDNEKVAAIVAEGFTFSEEVNRPYIDSPYKEIYGIRPASIYFDGTNDNDDIHPSIEGMTWEGRNVDEVVDATQIDDNGVLAEDATEAEKTFTITIPMAGFTLPDLISDESSIDMKNGMCGARSFKIKSVKKNENERDWNCTCWRTYDDTLKLYFPYIDFQISPHDNFVLTGIELPDSYIDAASEKLFFATVDALKANHAPRYTFQPRIDEIWMKRQDDIAKSSHGAIASLHDTLKSGDLFSFDDEDLGITAQIIIDILTIKENGNNGIPTYEVTLREEKVVSALDKRLDKITSVVSGVGGGLSGRQYSGMIALEGSELFLSKLYDDVAQGVIGFLKGAWFGAKQWYIDAAGNANFYNTTVNGILKAWNAIINNVRSSNYNGAGMLDTGWMITNEYQGYNSKAVFDYLYIRKKAEFEELEIRKISHIGGNLCLSPSSGRIWRVDYFDANDNLLGYDEHTVPWTLGGRIMNLFTKNPTILNKFLGKKKQIQRKLTDAEILNARKVRCYFFNDDGSTQTMLNWSVGAQARCQTFNIESQVKWDGNRYTGTGVANTYWWRLVSGAGSTTISGEKHYYIDFYVNVAEERRMAQAEEVCSWADAGSDLPMAGDIVVQFGHRTNVDQMNVTMEETTGGDAPAYKQYKGINSWNLNGTQKTKLSPTTGNVMYATKYHIETEYGDVLVPKDRGAWTDGMVCYYYDRVSYGGSLWLCIVAEGGSTTLTPGDGTAAQRQVWQKQVEKGDKGEASFKSQVFKRSATKPTKPTGGSYASPVPSGWSDGVPSGTDTIWMTTRIFSSDGNAPQQSEWTDVQLMSDTESFDVEFSPVANNPGNPTDNPNNWFDPTTDPSADWSNMIWMAERTKNNGVWGSWKITKIKGEQGEAGTNAITTALKYTGPLGPGDTVPTVANYGRFTWTDNIPTQTEAKPNVYVGVWKYDASTILDITSTAPQSVSLFAHYGKTGETGDDGLNGTSILAAPNAIVINQQRSGSGAEPLTNISYPIVVVARDSGTIVAATISNLTTSNCTASITKNNATDATVTISAISTYTEGGKTKYRTSGSVAFHVVARTAAGNSFEANISVPFACNLLGQYTIDIEEDVKTEIASKVAAEITAEGVLTSTNFDNKYENASWGVKQDITKTINEIKGDGSYNRSTGFTNSRLSTAEANITSLTTSLGNTYTKTETANYVSQQISTNNESYYTKSETSSLINTRISSNNNNYYNKTETSNLVSSEVKSGISELSSISLKDSDSWEQGSTDGESSGKTYDQIKIDSQARIRTIALWSISSDVRVTYNSNYQVGVLYFTAEKLVASTGWQGWFSGGDSTLSVPDDAHYVAVLVSKGGAAISPSDASTANVKLVCEAVASKSYVRQTADSYSAGVQTDIEGKLYNTGINIQGSNRSIALYGDSINFYKSREAGTSTSNLANIQFDLNKGGYYFNGTFYAENGAGIYLSGTNTSLRAGNDANIYATNDLYIEGGNVYVTGDTEFNDDVTIKDNLTVGKLSDHTGDATFYGQVIMNGSLYTGSGNLYLSTIVPNPVRGQVIFTHSMDGSDLTIRGNIMRASGSGTTSYVGGDQRSRMFIYSGSYWIEFACYY